MSCRTWRPERIDYVFTDVSPFFTQRAIELFGSREGFSTRLFDVERDPTDQGLATGSFDLVVASNVLHTTKRVAESLAHVESLVAPGGALVLMEVTRHPHWIDLIFGLTDGWWRFEDDGLRASHPILPEASWRSLLLQRGWSRVEALSDTNRPGAAAQTVIAARWEGRPDDSVRKTLARLRGQPRRGVEGHRVASATSSSFERATRIAGSMRHHSR